MDADRMRLDASCPACHTKPITYAAAKLDLPYFGDVFQLVFECDACGFRHSDFMASETHTPVRWTHRVRTLGDLDARVVRSTSGTVRIPELGAIIEPGPASDAYVSNIEGVLVRIQAILEQLCRDAEDPAQLEECRQRRARFDAAREGRLPFTFILEDPFGNSAVLHPDAASEPIPPEQAETLKHGVYTFNLQAEAAIKGNGHHEEDEA